MTSLKHKYLKLLLTAALALLFVAGVPSLSSGRAAADPQANCGAGAKLVQPQNGDPSYCVCKDSSKKIDATSDPEKCVDKCPANTVQDKAKGQVYCNPKAPASTDTSNVDCDQGTGSACMDAQCNAAQGTNSTCQDTAVDCDTSAGGQCDFIGKYINPAINLLSVTFALFMIISLILGGISYTTSEGDPQKASKAKRRIANTIIAVVAYVFFYAFLQFIIPGGAFNK